MTTDAASDTLRRLLGAGALDLPVPGRGRTPERLARLCGLARTEAVSVARLAEAHSDAAAIAAEAGGAPAPGALYGVWAAHQPGAVLVLDRETGTVSGTKAFCSGLGIADRALVTAVDSAGEQWLLDLEVRAGPTVGHDRSGWSTPALADTATGAATFDRHPAPPDARVGPPGWYLARPGFWHGACGPAACWAGAALGLADHAEAAIDDDPHRQAHLGAIRSEAWLLPAVLAEAGRQIDANPGDAEAACWRALAVRHTIERSCTRILDHLDRSLGPRPLTGDPGVAQRRADAHLYLRQDHGERDLHHLASVARHHDPSAAGPGPAFQGSS